MRQTMSALSASSESTAGLFRRESLGNGPARTLRNLFADLRQVTRGEIIGEDPQRHLEGARVREDRTQGHATWEFYRLDEDLYVVALNGVYDERRVETVPGEGLFEIHLRLAGVLEMVLPGHAGRVTIAGPRLLMMYQPPGVDVLEWLHPKQHDACVSMYCRPQLLSDLARRNGIEHWALLDEIEQNPGDRVWYREAELSPALLYIGTSLVESPYHRCIRLLHAEAKVLELLCELWANTQEKADPALHNVASENEIRQLDDARRILASNLSSPRRIRQIARAIGMSESKLKRTFKTRFGVTLFEYGRERRMQYALELLRCRRMSVGQVAYAAGYRHQTSFAAAFYDYFGFLPSKARTEMY